MSFFLAGDGRGKRKAGRGMGKRTGPFKSQTVNASDEVERKKSRRQMKLENTEISSDEEEDIAKAVEEDDGEEYEDVNQAAFRKAHKLLASLKEGAEDEDVEERLREKAAASAGRLHRKIAEGVDIEEEEISYRAHRFSVVGVAVSPCGRFVVSVGKESTIVKYDVEARKVVGKISRDKSIAEKERKTHSGLVEAVAISHDGRLIATGGHDAIVKLWDFTSLAHVADLRGHRSPITSLVFRLNSPHLFSCSHDKTIRLWDCDQIGFVDSMLGHNSAISCVAALSRERVVSAGGQDKTLRMWKVADESQLVFNGPSNCVSVDCVSMLNEDHFISGSSDGSLCLWSVLKKKPTCIQRHSHGVHESGEPRWVVSLCAIPYTDLVASGSNDGELRLWKISEDYRKMEELMTYQVTGFINNISFCPRRSLLVLAVGQEHKAGRWWKEADARNSVVILTLTGLEDLQANPDVQ